MNGLESIKRQLQDRWTVLSHHPDRRKDDVFLSAKGTIPESWLCVDCGINTAPGFATRKEAESALVLYGAVSQHMSDDQEVYCVTKEVWRASGLEGWGGCLCIGCLEKRIGRRLKPKDFEPEHSFNSPGFPATKRLRKRRGQ